MCTFRNSIIVFTALLLNCALLTQGCNAQQTVDQNPESSRHQNPYFPLAVGNFWSYRCSVEGKFQFNKKISITAKTASEERQTFRTETLVGTDPKPMVSYLSIDAGGTVVTSSKPTLEDMESVITMKPEVGERLGEFAVVAVGLSPEKKYSKVEIVRVENFSIADPNVPMEKRLEWLGRTYGKSIGLLIEADGLGGECILSTYNLNPAK